MTFTIDQRIGPGDLRRDLESDVRAGLLANPKWLPPKWFYDETGSKLFDEITRLPEYYPTSREREILVARSADIASLTEADSLVELGSGTSEKTRILLDAMRDAGSLRRFVGLDVSEETLREAGASLAGAYPGLDVHAVVGDFERHLDALPHGGRRVVAFLGGTIGNLAPPARARFLSSVAAILDEGDAFLLGTDLVKDPERLVRAYDDSAGVTAEFNRNVLRVVNRELGADFDVDSFVHQARWNAEDEWIEMRLRSTVDQQVAIRDLDLTVSFAADEEMRTEISAKFRRDRVEAELEAAGMTLAQWWTDPAGDFALSLAVPAGR